MVAAAVYRYTWITFWQKFAGPDVSIVPLVPKVDLPEVTLPWSVSSANYADRPWSVRIERTKQGNAMVQATVNQIGAGVNLNPDTARAMAHALLTVVGHEAIEEADGPCLTRP